MLVKNVTLNGIKLGSAESSENNIALTGFKRDVQLATFVLDRQTSPGSIVGRTLAKGRLYTITGFAFGTPEQKAAAMDVLAQAVRPDDLISGQPLIELLWQDFSGRNFRAEVQVYSMPEWTHENGDALAEFTFNLLSPSASYFGENPKARSVSLSTLGGMVFPTLLPKTLGGDPGAFVATNDGDYPAAVKIEVNGSIQDFKIRNIRNGRFYALSGVTTSALVIDGTKSPFTAKDGTVDVSGYRVAGSVTPMLLPGDNQISITGVFNPLLPPTVTFSWSDTYIS